DQGCDRSLNNRVIDIRHIDARRNDHKGLKHGSKGEVKRKANNNNIAIEKLVRVNRKFAQASIRDTKFMILEHTTFDENVLDKDCVNIRCIKSESTKSGDINYIRKTNRIISRIKEICINRKEPEREYLAEIRKVNDENLKSYSQEANCSDAMEKLEICNCDIVHDECKVDYNGIEAAD
ncbi:25725_t:CDS:2, partial [Gigaspora margarita]